MLISESGGDAALVRHPRNGLPNSTKALGIRHARECGLGFVCSVRSDADVSAPIDFGRAVPGADNQVAVARFSNAAAGA
jgi:hypothetical protein